MSATAVPTSTSPRRCGPPCPYILPVIGASILAGIGITIGLALLIVPGLILLTFWCLIVPFIVIGESGVFDSFRNSWRTVRGYAWNVFGTYVLVFLILIAFSIVLGFILILLPLWLRSFVNSVVTGTLIAPFLALVATLALLPPDRRPRLPAVHPHRPGRSHGVGAPLPRNPTPSRLPHPAPGTPGRRQRPPRIPARQTVPHHPRPPRARPRGPRSSNVIRRRNQTRPSQAQQHPTRRNSGPAGHHRLQAPPDSRTGSGSGL